MAKKGTIMPPPVFALALVPIVIKTIIGAKLIGFAASWATSSANGSMRESFLHHVDHVREGLLEHGIPLEESSDVDLLAHIDTLRGSAKQGWTEPSQTRALWEVMKFLSWAHAKATTKGVGKFTASHPGAAYELAEKAGLQILDFVLPEKRNDK